MFKLNKNFNYVIKQKTFSILLALSWKASISDSMGLYEGIWNGQQACCANIYVKANINAE